jgi:hypothetical protein
VTLVTLVTFVTLEAFVTLVTFVTLEAFVTFVIFVTLVALVTFVTLVTLEAFVTLEILEQTSITILSVGILGKVTKAYTGVRKITTTTTPSKNACQGGSDGVENKKTGRISTEESKYHAQEMTPRNDTTGIQERRTIKGRRHQRITKGSARTFG